MVYCYCEYHGCGTKQMYRKVSPSATFCVIGRTRYNYYVAFVPSDGSGVLTLILYILWSSHPLPSLGVKNTEGRPRYETNMNISENIPLAQFTTFKIGGNARFFCTVEDENELLEVVKFSHEKNVKIFVLGGGSNILVSDGGFDGLVIKMEIRGINSKFQIPNSKEQGDGNVLISVGAGENWDAFVSDTVSRGYYGLENLSHIPGTVGAAPVQNIGAYGAEVSQTIISVRALDLRGEFGVPKYVDIPNLMCEFEYRDSRFKHEKGRFIITRVDFELDLTGHANISYKDLKEYFKAKKLAGKTISSEVQTPLSVRNAVIEIRSRKLPDWTKVATAGSFFKNPIISSEKFDELKKFYPEMPSFSEKDGRVKVPLGWILDKVCGVKGMAKERVGTYGNQALVLVAQGGAMAGEVESFAGELAKIVKDKTGIDIEWEVEKVE